MTATIIPFPGGGRPPRNVLVISEEPDGQVRVGVSPELTDRDRDFAHLFPDAFAARKWAGELRATYPNIFIAINDTAGRAEGART